MSHSFPMIPTIRGSDLPDYVIEFCWDCGYSLHGVNEVVEVDLEGRNPLRDWVEEQGYQFPLEAMNRGWGYVALMES